MTKLLLLPAILLLAVNAPAQKPLPLIRAGSSTAWIMEGKQEKSAWGLSPETRPDVYTLNKSPKATRVVFYTDVDSISVKLKPGQHFDFVVLLKGKDSCFTRLESPAIQDFSQVKPVRRDTFPFVLTEFNNIALKVVMDEKDTLDLKFDSGAGDFLLTNDLINNQLHLKNLDNHTFRMGSLRWERQRIYPVELSGQGTVGRFGWNIFDGRVVEIDYDHLRFIVHSRAPKIGKGYAKFDIEYTNGLFCIQGALQIKGRQFPNRFLFDNGYQRTIMLDEMLMREQRYPKDSLEVIKKVIMKNGQGKEIPVLTVNNERLNLGQYSLTNIPVQLLSSGNPARFKTHILGNEVLKRFNTILDFQKNIVYLKPNRLYDVPYAEQKKGG